MDAKTLYSAVFVALSVAILAGGLLIASGDSAIREDAWYLPVMFILAWVTVKYRNEA
jgi:hypothetical protein